jgi:hypothetical protein
VRPFWYVASVEDPFDATDNCGRSIHNETIGRVLGAFQSGSLAFRDASRSSEYLSSQGSGLGPLHSAGVLLPCHALLESAQRAWSCLQGGMRSLK